MIISGYQPCSLSDYPSCVAAILFTQGCNFRCPFCHNASLLPLQSQSFIAVEEILGKLRAHRGLIDGVVVTGGEPTLHADLASLLKALRDLGFKVKLDTNGSNPTMLRELLQAGLIDYLAMDLKAPWDKYDWLAGKAVSKESIKESLEIVAKSGIQHEFRTTMVPALLTKEDLIGIEMLIPRGSLHRVQTFRPENAFDPRLREKR